MTNWITDKVAPDYWVPNSKITVSVKWSLNETRDKDLVDEKSGISIKRQIAVFPVHHILLRALAVQRLEGIINSTVTKPVEEWVLNAPIKRWYSILMTAAETRRFEFENWKTLNNNDRNLVPGQRFSWFWFAAGARSCRLIKTSSAHYYFTISWKWSFCRAKQYMHALGSHFGHRPLLVLLPGELENPVCTG